MPEDTDIVVRERMRARRDVVLVRDVSGSIRGEEVRMAVAALSADLVEDRLAVVAFWSDAALLIPLDAHVPAARLLDQLLRIPARGLTGEHDAPLGADLARLGRGRFARVATHRDVAPGGEPPAGVGQRALRRV